MARKGVFNCERLLSQLLIVGILGHPTTVLTTDEVQPTSTPTDKTAHFLKSGVFRLLPRLRLTDAAAQALQGSLHLRRAGKATAEGGSSPRNRSNGKPRVRMLVLLVAVVVVNSSSSCTCSSSLYGITELLSRIKYGNRGIFYDTTFSVVDHFPPP